MSERIKLIWDFRGPDAKHIAEHHSEKLTDYAKAQKLNDVICDIQELTGMHAIAYMVVDKEEMEPVNSVLRPHRAQHYQE